MNRRAILSALLLTLLISLLPSVVVFAQGGAPVFNNAAAQVTNSNNLVVIALPFSGTPGQSYFSVIDWGDGTVQPGLLTSSIVNGAHTYGVAGTYTIRVALSASSGLTANWQTSVVIGAQAMTYTVDPTLPGAALCSEYNGLTTANVRAGVPAAINQQVYCRLLSVNGLFTGWQGMLPAGGGHIGNQTVIDAGVIQAVDIFSTSGLAAPTGVAVCLRGEGVMALLTGIPRAINWLGTFTSPNAPGFTCAAVPQFGTLVLLTPSPEYLAAQAQQQGGGNIVTASGRVLPPLPEYAPGVWIAQTGQCIPVTRGMVYVRAEPNEGSTSLAILPHNNPVQIDGMIGVWYAVTVNGLEGFIRADLLGFECGIYAGVG